MIEQNILEKFRLGSQAAREVLAEFLGTLILTLCGNAILATLFLSRSTIGAVVGPLGWTLALVLALYVSAGVSGGHLNPAVTVALASIGKLPWKKVPHYVLAQYVGAFVASVILYGVYVDGINNLGPRTIPPHSNATAQIFATYPQEFVSTGSGFLDQVVGTAMLMLAICGTTDEMNMSVPKGLAPLIIGLCFGCVQFVFSFNCMAAVNPARDLAPRIFTAMAGWGTEVFSFRDYNWFWVPVVGPHVGALAGAWIYLVLVGMHWPDQFDLDNDRSGESIRMKRLEDDSGNHQNHVTTSHH